MSFPRSPGPSPLILILGRRRCHKDPDPKAMSGSAPPAEGTTVRVRRRAGTRRVVSDTESKGTPEEVGERHYESLPGPEESSPSRLSQKFPGLSHKNRDARSHDTEVLTRDGPTVARRHWCTLTYPRRYTGMRNKYLVLYA